MRVCTVVVVIGSFMAVDVEATNWIYAWGTTGTYSIVQEDATVDILSPGTFKFYALEGSMTGHINSITIPGDVFVDGDVYLYVASPYHPVGAEYVKRIDLSRAAFSEIKELRLSGDLAEDGTLYATRLSGDFAVGGDILNDIEIWLLDADVSCSSMRNLSALPPTLLSPLAHTGSIEIEGPYAHAIDIEGSFAGDISVSGDMSGLIQVSYDPAYVWVRDLSGDIVVGHDLNLALAGHVNTNITGSIWVGNDLTTGIYIWNNVSGSLEIGNNVANAAFISIVEAFGQPLTMYGTITIAGDLSGAINIHGDLCDPLQDMTGGHIIVNGSLNSPGEIYIDGDYCGVTEYIAIDYDGWNESDKWYWPATVTIDGRSYDQNTPTARVWDIMSCKGNMNNSGTDPDEEYGQLDPNDPNILAIAINDPNDYAALFPGLEGSLSWHGDVYCDESIDQDDLTALEWRSRTIAA